MKKLILTTILIAAIGVVKAQMNGIVIYGESTSKSENYKYNPKTGRFKPVPPSKRKAIDFDTTGTPMRYYYGDSEEIKYRLWTNKFLLDSIIKYREIADFYYTINDTLHGNFFIKKRDVFINQNENKLNAYRKKILETKYKIVLP